MPKRRQPSQPSSAPRTPRPASSTRKKAASSDPAAETPKKPARRPPAAPKPKRQPSAVPPASVPGRRRTAELPFSAAAPVSGKASGRKTADAERLHIVMAASEAHPFAKTGGLAEVTGALPVALARLGHRVTLVLPRYRTVDAGPAEQAVLSIGGRAPPLWFAARAAGDRGGDVF